MSSTYIVEHKKECSKKDDTLILMVNDSGIISVDQDTLQSLILNQSNANVSVVKLGQIGDDVVKGNITLTVDPPTFVSGNASDPATLVDPFMEMDSEQLERLEIALQSEEAKQILGENVTAMLDLLTVEEQQNSIKHSIELDHCYTSRFSSLQSQIADPVPDDSCTGMSESVVIDHNDLLMEDDLEQISAISSSSCSTVPTALVKQKVISITSKIVQQPNLFVNRSKRALNASKLQCITTPSKLLSSSTDAHRILTQVEGRTSSKVIVDQEINDQRTVQQQLLEKSDNQLFSSSESSASDSDSDSDFGPWSPRRGIRARGGRRGLTTRGGSMAALRRRCSNKLIDNEQVRRLDFEMVETGSTMKNSDKEEKLNKHSSKSLSRTVKIISPKRKEDSVVLIRTPSQEQLIPLRTQSQTKFQTIHLLTPSQIQLEQQPLPPQLLPVSPSLMKQNVLQIMNKVKTNKIKEDSLFSNLSLDPARNIPFAQNQTGVKKDVKVPDLPVTMEKGLASLNVHHFASNDVNLKTISSCQKTELLAEAKNCQKSTDSKKEKKKGDNISDTWHKSSVEETQLSDNKVSNVVKKVIKKEYRKSDVLVAEALGPALFSTPDIIRRVGSNYETKTSESPAASLISATPLLPSTSDVIPSITSTNIVHEQVERSPPLDIPANKIVTKFSSDTPVLVGPLEDNKIRKQSEVSDLIPSATDCVTGRIEADEHLLATLGVEVDKQLPNDELLAEALLLQETLGADLEHSTLIDSAPEISESLLTSSIKEAVSKIEVSKILSQSPTQSTPLGTFTPIAISSTSVKSEPIAKKDSIQIIRGGRVIILPPMEAPATRSKRLQAKTDNHRMKNEKKFQVQYQSQTQPLQHNDQEQDYQKPKVEPSKIKSERTLRVPAHMGLKNCDMMYDIDDNDEEEVNSGSEDDPNRLWCICRQPHNNRFMICCDMCQDWFHGKCVHVTKTMGEQMENQGIEWVCPNCLKKKTEEFKLNSASKRHKSSTDRNTQKLNKISSTYISSPSTKKSDLKITPVDTGSNLSSSSDVTFCVVCKKKVRKSGIYCSDACIVAHAASQIKGQNIDNHQISQKQKSDIRIVVYNKKTGKVLTGPGAPTASNLKNWLLEHPYYAVVKSNNLNTIQLGCKTVAAIKTKGLTTVHPSDFTAIKQRNKQLQGRPPTQSKTIHAKVPDPQQTILSLVTKKSLPESPLVCADVSNEQCLKHSSVTTTSKKSVTFKQEMTKSGFPQSHIQIPNQQIVQQPTETLESKVSSKKLLEAKSSTFLQKNQQQSEQFTKQQQQKSPPLPQQQQQPVITRVLSKKSEIEPVRVNVRKTLADLLISRIKQADDLNINEEEVKDLALKIELEMYKYFKDTGSKYKAKYRSLVFNIKDTKNLTLFHKIADHSLAPGAVVRLSPEEMASQELAEWREKETKHQLDMIKKNELDMMAQAKSVVVKTHKGEQIIENDGGIRNVDPQDIVTVFNSSSSSQLTTSTLRDGEEGLQRPQLFLRDRDILKKPDRRHSRSHGRNRHRHKDRECSYQTKSKKDTKHRDKARLRNKDYKKFRDRDKKNDKDRDRKKDKYDSGHNGRSLDGIITESKLVSHKEHKDKQKQAQLEQSEHELWQKQDTLHQQLKASSATSILASFKPVEERLWRHIEDDVTNNLPDGNESDISDREPSSTVTIKTPDINDDIDGDFEPRSNEVVPCFQTLSAPVWHGFVYMADVAKFYVTAQSVSGHAKELMEGVSDAFEVVGRISPLTVWDYIDKMRKNATKEIVIVKLTATNDEEKIPYITLFSYLNSRNRLGVLGNVSPKIKDFYIMPFSSTNKLPSVLLSIENSGLKEIEEPLLLGIIVVHSRKKRPSITCNSTLSFAGLSSPKMPKKESLLSDTTTPQGYTPPPQVLPTLQRQANTKNEVILAQRFSRSSSIVPELSSQIVLTTSSLSKKIQLLSDIDNSDDRNNEPYSPGEPVDVALDDSANSNAVQSSLNVKTPKSSSELQRKMEEITRQIEEEKQQIQNISSTFLGDNSTILPGLDLHPLKCSDALETYSPTASRSFTPPPQSISNLTQPILDKVSNITIPPNLQEILANVKRQESSKLDSYIPLKPGATFLTTLSSIECRNEENHSSAYNKTLNKNILNSEVHSSQQRESKSTLSLLSDYDIIKKAEKELAAIAVADIAAVDSTSSFSSPNETQNFSTSSVI
ncbi:uncharacterized protein LOC106637226 isoform X2 [Copidosoma floridanum]|uniref:uncharacterized protein LOC106637226 isoform X2 n=1 Tax=Copidosoma floridanum TaxID=29053 RepID=UPI0006C9B4D2|nr:uncharacterized protein LOC106637226 isoform X2 [Copidosoma floridanum]